MSGRRFTRPMAFFKIMAAAALIFAAFANATQAANSTALSNGQFVISGEPSSQELIDKALYQALIININENGYAWGSAQVPVPENMGTEQVFSGTGSISLGGSYNFDDGRFSGDFTYNNTVSYYRFTGTGRRIEGNWTYVASGEVSSVEEGGNTIFTFSGQGSTVGKSQRFDGTVDDLNSSGKYIRGVTYSGQLPSSGKEEESEGQEVDEQSAQDNSTAGSDLNPIEEGQNRNGLSVTRIVGDGQVIWDDAAKLFHVSTGTSGRVRFEYNGATVVLAPGSEIWFFPIPQYLSLTADSMSFMRKGSLVFIKDTKSAKPREYWGTEINDGRQIKEELDNMPPPAPGEVVAVLGTQYYVRYSDQGLETFLEEGEIEVSNDANAKPARLTAGQKLTVNRQNSFSGPERIDDETLATLARDVAIPEGDDGNSLYTWAALAVSAVLLAALASGGYAVARRRGKPKAA